MKLFTEQQVIALTQAAYTAGQNHNAYIFGHQCSEITPIELPSDEDIEKICENSSWYEGAKWLRDKITGADK